MKPNTILFLVSIFFSSHAFAWTITADFEEGKIGDKAESPSTDAFHIVAGHSQYASTPALSGSQSGSVTATAGNTGFGVWGGGFNFPSNLKQGDQIWFRINVLYPEGWDFSCDGCRQGMKFMRIHTATSGGSNEGFYNTLIKGSSTGGLITADSEVLGSEFWINNGNGDVFDKGTPVIRGKWHTYEQYVKWSSVPGEGIYRIWQDGNLIFEDLKTATLRSSTSISDYIYLYTYWNNGAPRTQTSYVDDVVVTNEVPSKKDANGNPYIGVGPSKYIAPPKSPTPVTN